MFSSSNDEVCAHTPDDYVCRVCIAFQLSEFSRNAQVLIDRSFTSIPLSLDLGDLRGFS